jgi:DNA-binding LytR/AlgR family response regulator
MLKIAICDDEKFFRKEIRDILISYLNEKGIAHSIDAFDSGEEFVLRKIEMLKYDVVFLDINMDRMDGLETAGKIREISKDIFIVFVTAYIDYTLEGYKVDAIRYILKNNNTLKNAVRECMDAIRGKMNYSVTKKEFDFLEGKRSVYPDRILYAESNLHKLTFHIMEDGLREYTIYMTLDELEKNLTGEGFLRIHQSYLVNLSHVEKVVRYSLFLDDGTELSIPKTRYKDVQKAVAEYRGIL